MSMQGAGEIIRFRTDSPKIGVRAEFSEIFVGNHRSGSAGFDLYAGKGIDFKFCGNRVIAPNEDYFDGLYENHQINSGGLYDYSLYFPFHCAVSAISIGVAQGRVIESPLPHKIKKPIVFYGSSITNCGAAGCPGLVYPSIISRYLDFYLINMGFSGSCRGELCIADTIAELDIAAWVMEFEHNAPTVAFLAERHESFFKRYRAKRPDVPVLMMSRCDFQPNADNKLRRDIIMRTFLNAVNAGDKYVDFLDGETLFSGAFREDCTADKCHSNDYGAVVMSRHIADRLKRMI